MAVLNGIVRRIKLNLLKISLIFFKQILNPEQCKNYQGGRKLTCTFVLKKK